MPNDFPPFFSGMTGVEERDREGQGVVDKQKKCFVMKEQRRSFTFCSNRPGCSSGSVPPGPTSGSLLWNHLGNLSVLAGRSTKELFAQIVVNQFVF